MTLWMATVVMPLKMQRCEAMGFVVFNLSLEKYGQLNQTQGVCRIYRSSSVVYIGCHVCTELLCLTPEDVMLPTDSKLGLGCPTLATRMRVSRVAVLSKCAVTVTGFCQFLFTSRGYERVVFVSVLRV